MATVSACGAGWHRLDSLRLCAVPARTQVQVWQAGRMTLLHGVSFDGDTIGGVPFTAPLDCDSCRLRIAVGTVDSVRTGSLQRGFFRTLGVVVMIGGLLVYQTRGLSAD